MMSKGRRYTDEQQQEDISRGQFEARLAEYGWMASGIKDRGEDFIVQIWDKGHWTGLSFFVQLKSTQDIESLAIKGGYISYKVKVKDLMHWNRPASPVIFVVWDVKRELGYWVNVADAISELDKGNEKWRQQKTVQVRIPFSNSSSTDDAGLSRLRMTLADYMLPSVSNDQPFEIEASFLFPNTPDGKAVREAVERHFAAGDPVTVDGQYLQKLQLPEWYKRLYGDFDLADSRLSLGLAKPEISKQVRLDFISEKGVIASVPYVDLQAVKGGAEEVTLSNEHQPISMHFRFMTSRSDRRISLSLTVTGPGASIQETRDIVSLLGGLAEANKLRITDLTTLEAIEVEHLKTLEDLPVLDSRFLDLIAKLYLIQERTGCRLALNPDWSISKDDFQMAHRLHQIIETGRFLENGTAILKIRNRREALVPILELHWAGLPLKLILQGESAPELLGTRIPLGPWRQRIEGVISVPVAELEQRVASAKPDEELDIELVDVHSITEFTNWIDEQNHDHPTTA